MSKLPDSGSKAVRKGGPGFGIPTEGSARRAGDCQLGRRQPKKTPWNPNASVERKGGAGFGTPTEGSARRAGDDAFTRPVKKKTYWKSDS